MANWIRLAAGAVAGAGTGYFVALLAAGLSQSEDAVPALLRPLTYEGLADAVLAIGALTGAAVVVLRDNR